MNEYGLGYRNPIQHKKSIKALNTNIYKRRAYMKKNVILLLLMSFVMVFSGLNTASAEVRDMTLDKNTKEQDMQNRMADLKSAEITKLLSELGEHRAEKLLASEDNVVANQEYKLDETEIKLEARLKELGVTELTESEVAELKLEGKIINPQATVPISTSATKWYNERHYYALNGKEYEIQRISAQAITSKSSLSNSGDKLLYTNKQIAVNNLNELASLYVEKLIGAAVGTVKVVGWLPYELLFPNNTKVISSQHRVVYVSTSTVAFNYAKLYGQSDSYQQLSFVSNMSSLAQSHILTGIDNGVGYSKSNDKVNTVYAENYASLKSAAQAFENPYAQGQSFIRKYVFYNHDKTASITQYLENPTFPVQVN